MPATAAPAQPTPIAELMDVVTAYAAAVNRYDASAIPALFPEQFSVSTLDEDILTNQKQLADAYAYDAAQHNGMKLADCWQSGANHVNCHASVWDDCQKAAGVPALNVILAFTIMDKKIKVFSTTYADLSGAQRNALEDWYFNGLAPWLTRERQAQRARLFDSHGNPVMNAETGALWSQLCQEYAATRK